MSKAPHRDIGVKLIVALAVALFGALTSFTPARAEIPPVDPPPGTAKDAIAVWIDVDSARAWFDALTNHRGQDSDPGADSVVLWLPYNQAKEVYRALSTTGASSVTISLQAPTANSLLKNLVYQQLGQYSGPAVNQIANLTRGARQPMKDATLHALTLLSSSVVFLDPLAADLSSILEASLSASSVGPQPLPIHLDGRTQLLLNEGGMVGGRYVQLTMRSQNVPANFTLDPQDARALVASLRHGAATQVPVLAPGSDAGFVKLVRLTPFFDQNERPVPNNIYSGIMPASLLDDQLNRLCQALHYRAF